MNPDLVCLECTLIAPQCDGNDKGCKFVALTVAPGIIESREAKRKADIEKQGDLFAAEKHRRANRKTMRRKRRGDRIRRDLLEILLSL
jgi:hypothetical protein